MKLVTLCIAAVWIINGLFCKLLNLVPRHQQIVGRILGEEYVRMFTMAIGAGELLIACWIISSIYRRGCAITQIILIAVMNTIEFFLVPDLLLFGKLNSIFALALICVIYYNEFILRPKSAYFNY